MTSLFGMAGTVTLWPAPSVTRRTMKGLTGGLEFEISRELERRTGRAPQGFFCPWNAPVEHRNLGFGGSAGYSGLAAAQATVPDVLIDVLRAKLALDRLGAQIKDWTPGTPSGLGVMLPTKASAATVSWVSDGSSAASESNMTVTQAAMAPHTCTAYTDVTRRMMSLGGPSFEKHVIDDLVTGLKIGIDAAAINGVGANGTLLGLFQNSNIPQFVPASDSGDGGRRSGLIWSRWRKPSAPRAEMHRPMRGSDS